MAVLPLLYFSNLTQTLTYFSREMKSSVDITPLKETQVCPYTQRLYRLLSVIPVQTVVYNNLQHIRQMCVDRREQACLLPTSN